MPNTCFVPRCTSGYRSNPEKVSMFKVHADKLILWEENIGRKDKQLSSNDYVCEKHFEEHFVLREINTAVYSYSLKCPKLSEDAVPTIFPGRPAYSTSIANEKPEIVVTPAPIAILPIKLEEKLPDLVQESIDIPPDIKPDSFEDLLYNLINRIVVPELPCPSWAIHSSHDQICISQMVWPSRGECVMSKKIILFENTVKYYVFDHLIENNTILDNKKISSLEDLQDMLLLFNNLSVCYGGISVDKAPANFQNPCYYKASPLNVWRHVKCSFIMEDKVNQCQFCFKHKRVVRYFKRKKLVRPTEGDLNRRLLNISKREKRLKIKVERLEKEVQAAREKNKDSL